MLDREEEQEVGVMMLRQEAERWLAGADIPVRLSCVRHSGGPMVLSLWYLYDQGRLYCATQRRAKVVRCLRETPVAPLRSR